MRPHRLLFALVLVLCFAAAPPALAAAEQGDAEPPACHVQPGDADAENVNPEDRCKEGEQDAPAPASCGGGGGEPAPAPAPAPGGGDDEGADDAGADEDETDDEDEIDLPFESAREYRDFCEAPAFENGFLRRAWRFDGASQSFEGGVLSITLGALPRIPARFRRQAEQLVGLEVAVVVGRRTKLVRRAGARSSRRGRGATRRVNRRALSRASRVQVDGKLLPPSRWRKDAGGARVPTVSARRIVVAS